MIANAPAAPGCWLIPGTWSPRLPRLRRTITQPWRNNNPEARLVGADHQADHNNIRQRPILGRRAKAYSPKW